MKKRYTVYMACALVLAVLISVAYAGLKTETNRVTYTDKQWFRSDVEFNSIVPSRDSNVTFGANSNINFASGGTLTIASVPYFTGGIKKDVVIVNGLEDLSAWTTSGGSYIQTEPGKTYLFHLASIATKQNDANQWGSSTTGITIFSAVTAVLPYCDDSWANEQTVTIIHADSATTPVQVWAGVPSGTTNYNKDAYASKAQNLEVTWSTTTITSGVSDWSLNGAQEYATWTLYCSNVATDVVAGVSAYKTQSHYIAW